MSDFRRLSTSKRPTRKTKPLSTVDIENELCNNSNISFSDDGDSFNSTSSSE